MKTRGVITAIIISSIIYIFFIPAEPVFVNIIFKILPMLLIIYYGYTSRKKENKVYFWLVMAGLIVCTAGDALIRISFIEGLVAFLIGHLFYIPAFLAKSHVSWLRLAIIIPLILYDYWIGSQLINAIQRIGEGALIIPVIFYIAVISTMFLTAIMTKNTWLVIGSTLFVISDSVLAWNKFVGTVAFSDEIIMITYYSAQFFIAKSIGNSVSESKVRISFNKTIKQ